MAMCGRSAACPIASCVVRQAQHADGALDSVPVAAMAFRAASVTHPRLIAAAMGREKQSGGARRKPGFLCGGLPEGWVCVMCAAQPQAGLDIARCRASMCLPSPPLPAGGGRPQLPRIASKSGTLKPLTLLKDRQDDFMIAVGFCCHGPNRGCVSARLAAGCPPASLYSTCSFLPPLRHHRCRAA